MSNQVTDEMMKRVERDTRLLIGDQAIQIIVLRAALEASKPFPKGPIPPQPEIEDHPPMDWPKDKPWPPTLEEWKRRGLPKEDPEPLPPLRKHLSGKKNGEMRFSPPPE